MANQVVRFSMSDAATTAALGINLVDADVNARLEAGALGLLVRGSTAVSGVCTDNSGNIYVADSARHVILRIDEGGRISTLAGLAGTAGRNGTLVNVAPTTARFNTPRGLVCDRSGNIYVADSGNNQIRVIETNGYVSFVAGNGGGIAGLVDGVGGDARFSGPRDVAVDSTGVVYVADTGNHCIRKITSGTVLTICGSGAAADSENVRASNNTASFSSPEALAIDNKGDIIVCDTGNHKIKKIDKKGWLYLLSGTGVAGNSLGTAGNQSYTCTYRDLLLCDIDKSNNFYVVDNDDSTNNSRLLRIDPEGVPAVIHWFDQTSHPGQVIGVCVSPGQKLFVIISSST